MSFLGGELSNVPQGSLSYNSAPHYIQELQNNLSQKLGAKIDIKHNVKGKGKLIVYYHSVDELDGILKHIK